MAKKKKEVDRSTEDINPNAHILGAGIVVEQKITETLEENYMPYAMSVIVSRAIPEIDGMKPSHRKLLYTMYKMGLLTGGRTKSANIVGATMKLNPHGDAAIYETMVRLSKGNESLLHPFVDSKGNFGKAYSKNMQYAASRYTEAKLSSFAAELFKDIDKNTVDFVPNYDNTTQEPLLFPVSVPTILTNANLGIAVGMASNICSFNLREICDTTIALIKNPEADLFETLKCPDFVGGAQVIYDRDALHSIFETGRGSVKIRSKYTYDKVNKCIDITEIPTTTTAEAIIEKIIELVKKGSFKEIKDIRDETDKKGLKITIDVKGGTDVEKLMSKLFRSTPLEDTFSCNFNVLIKGMPKVLGVRQILLEWIEFRTECVRRRLEFDLQKCKDRLHLLKGLEKILLDIDKAIQIIRNTEEEAEVVPNLMIGFGIDKIQAEYVAEIKLRHLNKEYILKRIKDIENLEENIALLEDILSSKQKIKKLIIAELKDVANKHGQDRRSEIIYIDEVEDEEKEEEIPDYPVILFFTREGYFKKILPLSWQKSSGEHKLKEGDEVIKMVETSNKTDLLFFTNKCQVYKSKANDFDETKASNLGEFVGSRLDMEEGETAIHMIATEDYKGYVMFFFENGKVAKVDLKSYETKTNRKKLIKAYSDKSPLVAVKYIEEDKEIVLISSAGRHLLIHTGVISPKTTKDTIGVSVMTLKKGQKLYEVRDYKQGEFAKPYRYKTKNLPALGMLLSAEDAGEAEEQISML